MATETGAVESAEDFAIDMFRCVDQAYDAVSFRYRKAANLIRQRDVAVRRAALEEAVSVIENFDDALPQQLVDDIRALLAQEKAEG